MLKIKRIYDPVAQEDGLRILVDRLWPRGIRKEEVKMDVWMKEIAPSVELRKWFNHEPEKWEEFSADYTFELRRNPVLSQLLDYLQHYENVTLLYAARNQQYNHAIILKEVLEKAVAENDCVQ